MSKDFKLVNIDSQYVCFFVIIVLMSETCEKPNLLSIVRYIHSLL